MAAMMINAEWEIPELKWRFVNGHLNGGLSSDVTD
jgi:hypothetical protein